MPRGAKRDRRMTKVAQDQGWFADSRSFISIDGHLYLRRLDKTFQRTLVFIKHKKCAVCGMNAIEHGEPGFQSEWHHKAKCDCIDCAEVRCGQLLRDCHRHRTAGFNRNASTQIENKKQIARKEFQKLYPSEG